MSSSKGNAISAFELVNIIPSELARFLLARVPYRRAINFDPNVNNTVPDLFDGYDRAMKEWYKNGNKSDLGLIYSYSQVKKLSAKPLFTPRFRQVAVFMQMPSIDLVKYFSIEKGSDLTKNEKNLLHERIEYARIWLENYADEKEKYDIKDKLPERAKELSQDQKQFLHSLAGLLKDQKFDSGEKLQFEVFELIKKSGLASPDAFKALYILLMNKEYGPKMGWVLFDLLQRKREFLLDRLKSV